MLLKCVDSKYGAQGKEEMNSVLLDYEDCSRSMILADSSEWVCNDSIHIGSIHIVLC